MNIAFSDNDNAVRADVETDPDESSARASFDLLEYGDDRILDNEKKEQFDMIQHKDIMSMYKSDVPFFTKSMLREIGKQLKDFKPENHDQSVNVTGIDGKTYTFTIGHNPVSVWPQTAGIVGMRQHLTAGYRSLQDLCNFSSNAPNYKFCTVMIQQHVVPYYKSTGQLCRNPRTISIEDAYSCFETAKKQWEESEQCVQLRTLLDSVELGHHIDKIVAFACGNMSSKTEDERSGPSYQHSLMLTLRDIVLSRKEPPSTVACFAQDPAYSDIDKAILQRSGVKVLEDPDGFIEVDESTIVLSFSPNVPVQQVIADIAKPYMMIWDTVIRHCDEEDMLRQMFTDPSSPRIIEMVDRYYRKLEFPEDLDHFGSVEIYVRV